MSWYVNSEVVLYQKTKHSALCIHDSSMTVVLFEQEMDVSSEASVLEAVKVVKEKHKSIFALVNNAGANCNKFALFFFDDILWDELCEMVLPPRNRVGFGLG